MKIICRLICMLAVVAVWGACTNEPYDSGDSTYSYLRADFAEVSVGEANSLREAWTDDGVRLQFSAPVECDWATVPDTTYRALVYYNRKETEAEVVSVVPVPVLSYKAVDDTTTVCTDPVTIESSWMSPNGKYFNMGLLFKTGKADGVDEQQVIGLYCDSIVDSHAGLHDYYLRFHHAQNGVPEYYTSRTYVSIPLSGFQTGDRVHLSVNTYSGVVTKTF